MCIFLAGFYASTEGASSCRFKTSSRTARVFNVTSRSSKTPAQRNKGGTLTALTAWQRTMQMRKKNEAYDGKWDLLQPELQRCMQII